MSAFTPAAVLDVDLHALRRALGQVDDESTVAAAVDAEQVAAAIAQAVAGATVLLVVAPSAWEAIGDLLAVGVEPAPLRASAGNPLVAERAALCTGAGTASGCDVVLERPGVLRAAWLTDDAVRATCPAGPVAVVVPRGLGRLVVVAGCLPEGGAVDAAAWAASAVAGPLADPQLESAEAAAGTLDRLAGHPAVPVVEVSGAWDTALLPAGVLDVDDPALLSAAGHAGRALPPQVYDALVDFADHGSPGGALLVRGAPTGVVPDTPPSPMEAVKADLVSEFVLLQCARVLGQPVGYAPEHGGSLVQNVCPTRAGAELQVSTSSRVVLEYHTEAAGHPHRPRFLLLLCLRGDPSAATTLCSVHAILPELSARERRVLAQPRFTTGVDFSYTGSASTARSLPRPILSGTALRPRLWLDNDLMLGVDDEAQAVLERIAELARTRGTAVVLQAGDLLVVDNEVAVHGRSPFTPRFDGTDRWLQRSMVVADHSVIGAELAGRIVATDFMR